MRITQQIYKSIQNKDVTNIRGLIVGLLFVQPLFSLLTSYPTLAEQACVKNSLGKVVCGELVPKKKATTAPSFSSKKVIKTKAGVDFTLDGCKKSNTGLTCFITIYNSTDYDKFVGYGNYYLFSITDSVGNVYSWAQDRAIGNQVNGSTLPPKMKIKSYVTFKPNGRLTDYIRILKILPNIENTTYNVTFRDFQID